MEFPSTRGSKYQSVQVMCAVLHDHPGFGRFCRYLLHDQTTKLSRLQHTFCWKHYRKISTATNKQSIMFMAIMIHWVDHVHTLLTQSFFSLFSFQCFNVTCSHFAFTKLFLAENQPLFVSIPRETRREREATQKWPWTEYEASPGHIIRTFQTSTFLLIFSQASSCSPNLQHSPKYYCHALIMNSLLHQCDTMNTNEKHD